MTILIHNATSYYVLSCNSSSQPLFEHFLHCFSSRHVSPSSLRTLHPPTPVCTNTLKHAHCSSSAQLPGCGLKLRQFTKVRASHTQANINNAGSYLLSVFPSTYYIHPTFFMLYAVIIEIPVLIVSLLQRKAQQEWPNNSNENLSRVLKLNYRH